MISKREVLSTLECYGKEFPEERWVVDALIDAIDSGIDFNSRSELGGHITCGAILLNSANEVMLVHHLFLDRWLLPGGHLEPQDNSLLSCAVREANEEVGLPETHLLAISPPGAIVPLDIDHHPIPANPRRGEGAHSHWDFRFVFRVRDFGLMEQSEEIKGASWRPVDDLPDRLQGKVRALLGRHLQWELVNGR